MKFKVIKKFRDKYTREVIGKGTVLDELEPSRVSELLEVGVGEVAMTKAELLSEIKERGIEFDSETVKKREDFIEVLLNHKPDSTQELIGTSSENESSDDRGTEGNSDAATGDENSDGNSGDENNPTTSTENVIPGEDGKTEGNPDPQD